MRYEYIASSASWPVPFILFMMLWLLPAFQMDTLSLMFFLMLSRHEDSELKLQLNCPLGVLRSLVVVWKV